ncbi:MAG: hypothetical protein IJV10_05705 [Prevotella sp.]|nr:hypothetical protein [Prevotella sp.]
MIFEKRRHIASIVLLAVFVPMLLLSSLHVHHIANAEDDCTECVMHHCHGHLGQLTTVEHNCVLCQFLSMSFVAATAVAIVYYAHVHSATAFASKRFVTIDAGNTVLLRGPPSLCN